MLPRQAHPTGVYSERIHARTFGYKLLIHAELEHYFEQRVLEVLDWASNLWLTSGKASKTIAALFAFYGKEIGWKDGSQKLQWLKSVDLGFRVAEAKREFSRVVHANNGVRERNLYHLLLPVGLQESDIDPVWLATIDAFGISRGDIAHRSTKAVNVLDPFVELTTVRAILAGIEPLDRLLTELMK